VCTLSFPILLCLLVCSCLQCMLLQSAINHAYPTPLAGYRSPSMFLCLSVCIKKLCLRRLSLSVCISVCVFTYISVCICRCVSVCVHMSVRVSVCAAASTWFENWGVLDPGEKISIFSGNFTKIIDFVGQISEKFRFFKVIIKFRLFKANFRRI